MFLEVGDVFGVDEVFFFGVWHESRGQRPLPAFTVFVRSYSRHGICIPIEQLASPLGPYAVRSMEELTSRNDESHTHTRHHHDDPAPTKDHPISPRSSPVTQPTKQSSYPEIRQFPSRFGIPYPLIPLNHPILIRIT